MRHKLLVTSLVLTTLLSSCSLRFWAYLRNLTDSIATVDVYINDTNYRKTLPTTIKTANKIVEFKSGHRRFFSDTTQIAWVDSSHFKVFLQPQTTIDFEDIAGYFLNSRPFSDIQVLVSSRQVTDTLMNGIMDFRREKFLYKHYGFIPGRPLLYFDIQDR